MKKLFAIVAVIGAFTFGSIQLAQAQVEFRPSEKLRGQIVHVPLQPLEHLSQWVSRIFSYKCILFFLFIKHYPFFILNKYCKLI